MKIAIVSGKGGTGKTFIATTLAYVYSQTVKTLLIDADVECPNDHLIFGIDMTFEKEIFHPIPYIDKTKCIKCGKCTEVCKTNSLVYIKNKVPAFVQNTCIGCMACEIACPENAISERKKIIGKIYSGKYKNLFFISGELVLGELASGDAVIDVKKYAKEKNNNSEITIIDSPAGTGCPVIAALVENDFIVMVTEPTPSALHDAQRVIYLADHFQIPKGIIINKYDLEKDFCLKIEKFAEDNNIPILAKIPYKKEFLDASLKMKPFVEIYPEYKGLITSLIAKIKNLKQLS